LNSAKAKWHKGVGLQVSDFKSIIKARRFAVLRNISERIVFRIFFKNIRKFPFSELIVSFFSDEDSQCPMILASRLNTAEISIIFSAFSG